MLIALTGVILWRKAEHHEDPSQAGELLSPEGMKGNLQESLGLVSKLIAAKKIQYDSICDSVDGVLDKIATIVDSRAVLYKKYSIGDVTKVMSEMAHAERILNRVWSMASDGYRNDEELLDLLRRVEHYLDASLSEYRALT